MEGDVLGQVANDAVRLPHLGDRENPSQDLKCVERTT